MLTKCQTGKCDCRSPGMTLGCKGCDSGQYIPQRDLHGLLTGLFKEVLGVHLKGGGAIYRKYLLGIRLAQLAISLYHQYMQYLYPGLYW